MASEDLEYIADVSQTTFMVLCVICQLLSSCIFIVRNRAVNFQLNFLVFYRLKRIIQFWVSKQFLYKRIKLVTPTILTNPVHLSNSFYKYTVVTSKWSLAKVNPFKCCVSIRLLLCHHMRCNRILQALHQDPIKILTGHQSLPSPQLTEWGSSINTSSQRAP